MTGPAEEGEQQPSAVEEGLAVAGEEAATNGQVQVTATEKPDSDQESPVVEEGDSDHKKEVVICLSLGKREQRVCFNIEGETACDAKLDTPIFVDLAQYLSFGEETTETGEPLVKMQRISA